MCSVFGVTFVRFVYFTIHHPQFRWCDLKESAGTSKREWKRARACQFIYTDCEWLSEWVSDKFILDPLYARLYTRFELRIRIKFSFIFLLYSEAHTLTQAAKQSTTLRLPLLPNNTQHTHMLGHSISWLCVEHISFAIRSSILCVVYVYCSQKPQSSSIYLVKTL